MNNDESRPRARTVFDIVRERHGGQPDSEENPPALMPEVVERPFDRRRNLVKQAASRELDRFAALTAVLGVHLVTGATLWPVLTAILKVIVSTLLLTSNSIVQFTWLQAFLLSGGLWLTGPFVFYLYRYWSGKF